jgi:Tfp pilus assembly protein PilX
MRTQRRREQGVVMFLTVLVLALMGGLGLAALDSASRDRDSAGYYNRETSAFYAAEAGISHARAIIRGVASTDELPAFPTDGNPQSIVGGSGGGVAANGQTAALYYGDPSVPNPIRSDGDSAGQYSEGMNLQSKGAKAMATLWTINVTGNGPDGASSRIEAKEVKFIFGGGY